MGLYEGDDSKTFFSSYVQMNQSNTGEPGRDAGCNISGLGTSPIVVGLQNLTVTNLAKIKTTKIQFDQILINSPQIYDTAHSGEK